MNGLLHQYGRTKQFIQHIVDIRNKYSCHSPMVGQHVHRAPSQRSPRLQLLSLRFKVGIAQISCCMPLLALRALTSQMLLIQYEYFCSECEGWGCHVPGIHIRNYPCAKYPADVTVARRADCNLSTRQQYEILCRRLHLSGTVLSSFAYNAAG